MKEENKFIKAVTKLIQLTQEGAIRWTLSKENRKITQGTENVVDLAYITVYEGQRLRLYELKYRDYFDEFQFTWGSQATLELIDDQGNAEWTFPPNNRAISDLLEAVQYQTSGVDEFIDRLLSKSENPPS
jgi:hypothetical protein